LYAVRVKKRDLVGTNGKVQNGPSLDQFKAKQLVCQLTESQYSIEISHFCVHIVACQGSIFYFYHLVFTEMWNGFHGMYLVEMVLYISK
jgi:hypothetical protein